MKAELPKVTAGCTKDDDCTITGHQRGNCCGVGCGPSEIAVHVDSEAAMRAWEDAHCTSGTYECKQYRCSRKDYSTKAVCRAGACESVRVPF